MITLRDKVWWFAIYTRVFVLTISSVFNLLLPDHAADAFVSPVRSNYSEKLGDIIVKYILGGLLRWDAQYFVHIAMYGYTYEQCLAFFPLFPLLSRITARILYVLFGGILNEFSLTLVSSVSLNVFFFVRSTSLLYELSIQILKNERLAYKACIFYCVSPASIFFTAPYSESLFACLTFSGLLKCCCGMKNKFSVNSGILFGLSALTRSNGLLNIGFILYKFAEDFLQKTLHNIVSELQQLRIHVLWKWPFVLMKASFIAFPYLVSVILASLPFIMYQIYAYHTFCIPNNQTLPDFLVSYAQLNEFVLPGSREQENNHNGHWCANSIPFSYSYIQSHYWNVGFLKYYRWKQIPNFVLALPAVSIILGETCTILKENSKYALHLGLLGFLKLEKKSYEEKSVLSIKETALPNYIFPYVIHALFVMLFSVLCAHVQVTTRLIASSSPLLYWYSAKITSQYIPKELLSNEKLSDHLLKVKKRSIKKGEMFTNYNIESAENQSSLWKVFIFDNVPLTPRTKLIHVYFLTYMVIGTILFSNFLPWT